MDHQIETSVFWVMNLAFFKNLNGFHVTQLPVSGSSLEEPYILIHVHDVFMMYYQITVSGFYTSLRVFIVFYNWRIFTSLKNT